MAYKDKAQKVAYQNEFIKKAYDRITVLVPKGDRERIQAYARGKNLSVNEYVKGLIEEDMKKCDLV